eukprot:scaffold1207_cov170-Alexandrium_tamarense.AAC.6
MVLTGREWVRCGAGWIESTQATSQQTPNSPEASDPPDSTPSRRYHTYYETYWFINEALRGVG